MNAYLNSSNFPGRTDELASQLTEILETDFSGSFFTVLGRWQQILADNRQKNQWPGLHDKLSILFRCGSPAVLDGPMIGIPLGIRNSDYFSDAARILGRERSHTASVEWLARAWNMTFADTGIWMGKAFEPLSRQALAQKCGNDETTVGKYNKQATRIGRNFFREPPDPNLLQEMSIPVLTPLWDLKDRPVSTDADLFGGTLTLETLEKEKNIPYSRTGSIYLGDFGRSVLRELNGKKVYQLNYRWPGLAPVFPMTRLVDELVQIDDGVYLGQLIYATRHYSFGSLSIPLFPDLPEIQIGEPYRPDPGPGSDEKYGYQNNGYFLMMDPTYAAEVYADDAFPQLRPRPGESGYTELGYDRPEGPAA